jgi:hypothetical protein
MYEEQGKQLLEARERQVESESYVTELRNRVNKLSERNRSGEVCRICMLNPNDS